MSGEPHGLLLGLLLFFNYMNDLGANVGGMVSKFPDDAMAGGMMGSEDDYDGILNNRSNGPKNDRWSLIEVNACCILVGQSRTGEAQ